MSANRRARAWRAAYGAIPDGLALRRRCACGDACADPTHHALVAQGPAGASCAVDGPTVLAVRAALAAGASRRAVAHATGVWSAAVAKLARDVPTTSRKADSGAS